MEYKMHCECYIDINDEEIVKCELCEAAPDMYEALDDLMEPQGINDGRVTERSCPSAESILKAQKALMKAEGK